MGKREIGQRGEEYAVNYLRRKDYDIVARNWRCVYGEIDIIAQDGAALVFVEVRTRTTSLDDALVSVTPRKQARFLRAIYAYLAAHDIPDDAAWRADVVAVLCDRPDSAKIAHVEAALDCW